MHRQSTGAEAFTSHDNEATLPFPALGIRPPPCSGAPIPPTSHRVLSPNEAAAKGYWNYPASHATSLDLSLILGDAVWVSFLTPELLSPGLVHQHSTLDAYRT